LNINYKKHKKILSLAVPSALNMLLDMFLVMTDLIMVGRISAFAVAAVGLGLQTLMFVFAIMTLLSVGTSALLSRFIGAKKIDQASLALSSLLRFAFGLSLVVSLLWYFFAPQIFIWFKTANEVASIGGEYVTILTFTLPLIFVKLVFTTALNASGDTVTPFYVKLLSIFLNLFLNWILIYGHFGFDPMGVKGAAIATVLVNIVEFMIYIYLYMNKRTIFKPLLHYSKKLINRALKVGIPASIDRTISFGSLLFFTMIISQYGTATLAGYQIGLRVEGLAFMPGIGFTIAATVLMGQGLGMKKPNLARENVMLVLKYTVSFMSLLGLFMILIPEKIVWVFTDDIQTIKEASLYLKIVGFSQVPLAVGFVLGGALRGAGDTKTTMKISVLSLWFVRIIPAIIFTYYFHSIKLVYLAMITNTFVTAIWFWKVFQKGKWAHIKV
jgi:putative MATE family efflux protein